MSNVMLVDTNFSSVPIYKYLVLAGHNVTVVGGNPNDALAKSAEDYVHLDYSDVEKTKRLIADRSVEKLVPGCNDRSYFVCSEINDNGQFPGIDPLITTEIINNKEKFRDFSAKHGMPTPRVLADHEIGTRWPVIVKPVDAYSGRGVNIIHENNKDEITLALVHARKESRTGTCIVEDYVEGQLYSHTAFIQSGNVIIDFIVEEHCSVNQFVVDTSKVIYNFPESLLESIRANIHLLANKLDLHDGLIHTQFISNNNNYWLIEITRRCPGDLYSQLIELSTGFKYADNYARPFVGEPFIFGKVKQNWVMRHTLTQPLSYTLDSIRFNLPFMLINWVPISRTGDMLQASPSGRIGIMFTEASSEQTLNKMINTTIEHQLYDINP